MEEESLTEIQQFENNRLAEFKSLAGYGFNPYPKH